MKKTITKIAIALSIATNVELKAQTIVTFDTFTLTPNNFYQDNAGTDFSFSNINFQYDWQSYWAGGTAYTNVNDTVNGTYTNLYGNITGTTVTGANYATIQNQAIITLGSNTAVTGFYITNTTYAWKIIKSGNQFSRRFGDTTGTGSGTSITQGEYPDWFKVLVRGYRNGNLLSDSAEFYLADYRSAGTTNDYVVKNWQFLNCSSLGQVDSIQFQMKSSDNSFGYMNTPAFFSIDNFTTQFSLGVNELSNTSNISLFPNPAQQYSTLNYDSDASTTLTIRIIDIAGKEIQNQTTKTVVGNNQINLNTASLQSGVYFINITDGTASKNIKLIKQ